MATGGNNTNLDNVTVDQILDTEYLVYSYKTVDDEPGSIICDPSLEPVFQNNVPLEMCESNYKIFKLRDLINNGFVSVGSTDLMETIKIRVPNKTIHPSTRPKIVGRYMHGSRKRLFADRTGLDFEYEPESDNETVEFDEVEDPGSTSSTGLEWLCGTTDNRNNNHVSEEKKSVDN